MSARVFFLVILGIMGIAILVSGIPQGGSPTSADTFGDWVLTGFLGTERTFLATATLLPNNQVLIVGGQAGSDATGQGNSNATDSAELYDRFEQVAIQILDSEFEGYAEGMLESLLMHYLDFGAQLLQVEFPEPRDQ